MKTLWEIWEVKIGSGTTVFYKRRKLESETNSRLNRVEGQHWLGRYDGSPLKNCAARLYMSDMKEVRQGTGNFRGGEGRKRRTKNLQDPSSLSFHCLATTSASLLSAPSLLLRPEKEIGRWRSSNRRRRMRGVRRKRRKGEEGSRRDERILKLWLGMEIRSWREKKKKKR